MTLSSFNALAGDTANLTIKGRFLPTTCDININGKENEVIDVGNIYYGELIKRHTGKVFPSNTFGESQKLTPFTLNVTCDSKASVGVGIMDNYKSFAPWAIGVAKLADNTKLSDAFAFKATSGSDLSRKIGGYYFKYSDSKADNIDSGLYGAQLSFFQSAKKAFVGNSKNTILWKKNEDDDEPIKAETFSTRITPVAYFYYDPKQKSKYTEDITFEGKTTFIVAYY
ncbi:hypothetical protein ACWWJF_01015 [Symbiopectobacterium sp. Eva_TO]